MFGKVKKWLGIEGVKIELELPELAFEEIGAVSGQIRFFSKNTQTVNSLSVVMIERYTRGRGKEKLVDEYLLGQITLDKQIEVPADDPVAIEFTVPFERINAPMDEFGKKNFLNKSLVRAARFISNVNSEYRIEAEATVEGTALNPFDKKAIKLVEKG